MRSSGSLRDVSTCASSWASTSWIDGEAIPVGTPAVSVRLVGAPKVVNGPRLAFHLRGNNAPLLVANSAGRFAPVSNSWPSPKRLRFRPVAMFQAWLGQPADP